MSQRNSVEGKPSRRQIRRFLTLLRAGEDLRLPMVRSLRAAVRARRYENDLKLSIAIDRLLAEVQ